MKRTTLTCCIAAMLLYACNNETKNESAGAPDTAAAAAEPGKKEEKTWVVVDSATATKAWMEYSMPGEAHKMLAKSNGEWTGEIKMWMSPDAPPMISTGSSSNRMIMDGRYQVSNFKGSFMGMPFEGISTTAYDNHKKVYISSWIDNMGTGIMTMEGPWDEASKTITMTGKMVNPTQPKECEVKQTYRFVDENTEIMEMYGPNPMTGDQMKTMEIKFTRKKK